MSTGYGFNGQFSNASDFGLLYFNARWLDPALGRFTQADSIVPAGVQGYDRYAFVNNNPVRYTDPSGHTIVSGDGHTCYGDKCSITHTILVGTSPAQPPLGGEPTSYGQATDESSCNNCSVEPETPAYVNGVAVGAVPVIADAGNAHILEQALYGDPKMFTFLSYEEYSDGAITVTSLTMINKTAMDVVVRDLAFISRVAKASSEETAYSVTRDWIGAPLEGGYGIGVIKENSIGTISLIPNGNSQNPTNTWDRNQSVDVIVRTGYFGYGGLNFYPDRTTIR